MTKFIHRINDTLNLAYKPIHPVPDVLGNFVSSQTKMSGQNIQAAAELLRSKEANERY
jgi:hypothetical protein